MRLETKYSILRRFAVDAGYLELDDASARHIVKAAASNGTISVHGKQIHCKRLERHVDDKDGADAISLELASLNAICTKDYSGVIRYLGFLEFTFDNLAIQTVIVSHCIDGKSFGQWNVEKQPILKRLQVVKQLALAVSFVHETGYCHNDLSPNNFMIVENGQGDVSIVLFDFGAARPPGKIEIVLPYQIQKYLNSHVFHCTRNYTLVNSGSQKKDKLTDGMKTVKYTSMLIRPSGTEGYIAPERLTIMSGSSTEDDQLSDLYRCGLIHGWDVTCLPGQLLSS